MIAVLILIFAVVALLAAAFVVLPLLRGPRGEADRRRPLFAVLASLGIMVVGLGFYAVLGQPGLALSALTGPSMTDYPELIATLARRMPDRPGDLEGWTLLGRGYMAVGNPEQAEKALERAVEVAKQLQGAAPPELLSSYGEAMAEAAGGVTKEAEAVFREALQEDPKEIYARYYVGLALASRGDKAGALELWEGVLADAPPDVPWRSSLINQMAALKAETGGMPAGGPMAMVAQLAARLETNPNDLNGWLMLIRAYSVLGDKAKAGAALAKARGVFADQAQALAMLAQSAKENALN
jgi:cytochrome c-type biogenesis protein CcmH